jgi:hypothetical protein
MLAGSGFHPLKVLKYSATEIAIFHHIQASVLPFTGTLIFIRRLFIPPPEGGG